MAIDEGAIPVLAGFQGVSPTTKDVTTLGRGGSDTTAVALARRRFGAQVRDLHRCRRRLAPIPASCRWPGDWTSSPTTKCRNSRHAVPRCSTCVASSTGVGTAYRSTCARPSPIWRAPGCFRRSHRRTSGKGRRGAANHLRGRAGSVRDEAHRLRGARPSGRGGRDLRSAGPSRVNLDMIVQNVSTGGRTDITFTLPATDAEVAIAAPEGAKSVIGFDASARMKRLRRCRSSAPVCAATPVSRRPSSEPCRVRGQRGDDLHLGDQDPVVCRADDAEKAVKALHTAFGLDADGEAVVSCRNGALKSMSRKPTLPSSAPPGLSGRSCSICSAPVRMSGRDPAAGVLPFRGQGAAGPR